MSTAGNTLWQNTKPHRTSENGFVFREAARAAQTTGATTRHAVQTPLTLTDLAATETVAVRGLGFFDFEFVAFDAGAIHFGDNAVRIFGSDIDE